MTICTISSYGSMSLKMSKVKVIIQNLAWQSENTKKHTSNTYCLALKYAHGPLKVLYIIDPIITVSKINKCILFSFKKCIYKR